MMSHLQSLLAAPRFADPEIDRVARSAHVCAMVFLGILLVWTPVAMVFQGGGAIPVIGVGATVTLLGVIRLARRGHSYEAAAILVTMVFLLACVGIWLEGGLRASGSGSFLAAVLAASLFFSARAAWGTAGLAVMILLLFWGLEEFGMLTPDLEIPVTQYLISNLTLVALVVSLVQLNIGRIRASQEFLRHVADATPHALYVYDAEADQLYYGNANTGTQLGYGRAAYEEKGGMRRVVHPDDREKVKQYGRTVMQSDDDTVHILDYRAKGADGDWRWIRDRSRVFERRPNGGVRQILGIAEDVTSEREAEAALERSNDRLRRAERMEALGRLAGGVAHDFNNYLTVIMGSAEAAARRIDDPDLRGMIEDIEDAAQRSAELTRQLLAFSRHQLIQPRTLELQTVLQDADRLLRRTLLDDIEIHLITPEEPCHVRADPGQIEQVILNLTLNARDAMPDGGELTVEVRSVDLDDQTLREHPEANSGRHVLLAFSDTGAGMDEETREQIFEPLFTTKDPGKGTGFGLATVEAIVRQCGGTIEVSSEPGAGSSFKIYLPQVEAESEESEPSSDEGRGELSGTEAVLLAEDDEMVRRLARRSLESRGYRVTTATDGSNALELFRANPDAFDLVLTDVMMPGLSGLEFARQARETRPELPFIFMSGYTANGLASRGLDPKEIILNKPFTIAELERRVRGAIEER